MDAKRHRDLLAVRCARARQARTSVVIAWVLGAFPLLAGAQVAVPPVQVPTVPPVDLPVDVNRTVSDTVRRLDPGKLSDARLLKVRDLIRKNPKVIEADPQGAAIVRSEVLALPSSPAALEKARAAGFVVVRERSLEGLERLGIVLDAARNEAGGPVISAPESAVTVLVVATDEELEMAGQAAALVASSV